MPFSRGAPIGFYPRATQPSPPADTLTHGAGPSSLTSSRWHKRLKEQRMGCHDSTGGRDQQPPPSLLLE
ncbi:hypothetical protein B0T26DRAFT_701202 [Lasiosphaeria miniovina]|uniref:Uncharacterized protein n=1 Tax=Lasiosphaeria miniovina TaxID=1954250 RepID=A0AA40AU54_9PEZI|nr:uncharacterized protein B0T26DRAFT_701202 [Lasiosphaeria miniovina]KAK0722068.1 hypothetical protein B0T26DRAFT_701202 [Lasiosphaeria miniovina]